MMMTYRTRWMAFVFLAGGVLASAAQAATPQQVDKAIQKAIAYLYAHQKHGTWDAPKPTEENNKHGRWGGHTAIATYALLASGESPQEAKLQKAIEFLKTADISGIYALGLRAQMWHFLPPKPEYKPFIKRDGDLLVSAIKTEGAAKAMFDYPVKVPAGGRYDHSVSQYGVLGLWAVAQCGYEVPTGVWVGMDNAWREHQTKDGGWEYFYNDKSDPRASMTAAGVATLFITQDYINMGKASECRGNINDQSIDRGLKWMETHFKSVASGKRSNYTLYGIERIGVASGRKYFGTIDWYDDGADFLVKSQDGNGGWGDLPDTCFAVLFLCRGRAPVVMNKLQYDIDVAGDKAKIANWNERPRDCANLVRWMGKQLERDLNWQIVNLRVPVDDLHDAPILYIAGNQNLVFSAGEEKKLKQFVEQGGMIFGNADCQSVQFTKAFEKLGQKLFPDYEFRDLPRDHMIFKQPFLSEKWRVVPQVRGMTNGSRELMVLLPTADYSRLWEMGVYGGREESHQLLWNLYHYAVDKKGLRNKGETYIVHKDSGAASRSIKVARLEYGGNWNPEPGGWRRLAAVMHNKNKIDIETSKVALGSGKLSSGEVKIAHLTGTNKFKLDEKAREELKKFVGGGGTLIVDSCGGNADFTVAAEEQLVSIFSANPNVLNPDHAVYSTGGKISQVSYRGFAKKIVGNTNAPRLKGITVNNRVAVFFSAEDLSTGLVGQPIDGIYGYEPGSATDLMRNMLVLADGGGESIAKADPPKSNPPKTTSPKPKGDGPKKKAGEKKK